MARLIWGNIEDKLYETGLDRGVLYVDNVGVAWNGLVSVEENPSGGQAKPYYLDGYKFLNRSQTEEFEATINAMYSPVEFDVCDGSFFLHKGMAITQQPKKPFGFSYRTMVYTADADTPPVYKIHLIYNALAEPTQRSNFSLTGNIDVNPLSWHITTRAEPVYEGRISSHFVINTSDIFPWAISALEEILYGNELEPPRLPSPIEVNALVNEWTTKLIVTDFGDGRYKLDGSDEVIDLSIDGQFEVTAESVTIIDGDSYTLSSTL